MYTTETIDDATKDARLQDSSYCTVGPDLKRKKKDNYSERRIVMKGVSIAYIGLRDELEGKSMTIEGAKRLSDDGSEM